MVQCHNPPSLADPSVIPEGALVVKAALLEEEHDFGVVVLLEEGFRRSSLPLVRGKGHQVSSPGPKHASGGQGADAVACHSCAV